VIFGSLYFFYIRPVQKQKAARLNTRKVELGSRSDDRASSDRVKMDDGLITCVSERCGTDFVLRRSLENTIHQRPCLNRPTTNTTKKATRSMANSRFSTIVDRQSHPHDRDCVRSLVDLVMGWVRKLGLDLPVPLGGLQTGHPRLDRNAKVVTF